MIANDKTAAGYMTAGTESRLQNAVGAVADMADEGMDPTDAAVKVAAAFGLLPDQLSLVCAAYNTGAHAALRKSAAAADRARQVPLVDSIAASVRAFGSAKLADLRRDPPPRAHFSGAPVKAACATRTAGREGSGSVVLLETAKRAAPAVDPRVEQYKKTAAAAAEFRRRAEESYHRLTAKIAELASYFCHQTYQVGWEDAWGDSVARHGKIASSLFATAQSLYPDVVRATTARPAYVAHHREPYSIVAECVKLAAECVDHVDGCVETEAEAEALRPVKCAAETDLPAVLRKSAGPAPTPGGGKGGGGAPSGPPPGGKADKGGKTPDSGQQEKPLGVLDTLKSTVKNTFAPVGQAITEPAARLADVQKADQDKKQKAYESTIRALVDPYAMSQQRTHDAQAMLTTLIGSDPVIGSHHPSKILAHYNEMSQLAPRLMENGAAVRAMLRQRLESGAGGIDPFQIEQLLKAENELRKRDDPAYGKGVLDL